VSDQETEALRRVNAKLRESLAMCRFMLAEARARLTANNNEEFELRPKDADKSRQ